MKRKANWELEADCKLAYKAKMEELLAVSKGCLGYLLNLPPTYRPDDSWLKPLIAAIRRAEAAGD